MVNVTYDWESFREYAEYHRVGTYSRHETVDGVELRVKAGKLGLVLSFPNKDWDNKKELLAEILRWCRLQGFIEIETTVSDEVFHS